MTDKELLELAAKAAGITGEYKPMTGSMHIGYSSFWNPLTDDGDALRLAVKLRMRVETNQRSSVVYWDDESAGSERTIYEYPESTQEEDFRIGHINQDAATRRAIVRAAAEIGKERK